ncbi:MAG: hypothetical protein ACKO5E_04095 [bacterium]
MGSPAVVLRDRLNEAKSKGDRGLLFDLQQQIINDYQKRLNSMRDQMVIEDYLQKIKQLLSQL